MKIDLTKHRNIFNGDWGTMFWAPNHWHPEGDPYTVKAIHRYVDLLAESGVDTFLVSGNTQVAWYPSKVTPTALDGYTRGHKRWEKWMPSIAPQTNIIMMNHYLDLVEAGVDWLAEAAKACRQHGISPWLSVRMNDMHGAGDPAGNPINCPLFANPNYRLRGTVMNPRDQLKSYWQALSYEHREVRDYMLTMIREQIMDYDYEGLELDWLRNPAICEPGCSQKAIDTVTAWVADIRALTEAKAKKTGRPFPLGMRIPGQLAMLRDIGLDVKGIVNAGFVDFINPGNFMQTSWDMPHDDLRKELGGDIAMYGIIEFISSGVKGYAPETGQRDWRTPCTSSPALRGNAAAKLVLGADGIEHYNYYAADEDNANARVVYDELMADYSQIRGVADLTSLRGQTKHYFLATMFPPSWYPPIDLPEPLPAILEPEWRRAFRLPMCAEPTDRNLELIVQVVIERRDERPPIGVSFNGSWPNFYARPTDELLFPSKPLTHHVPEHTALNYTFPAPAIKDGWNDMVVYNGSHKRDNREQRADNSVTIVSIELGVKQQL